MVHHAVAAALLERTSSNNKAMDSDSEASQQSSSSPSPSPSQQSPSTSFHAEPSLERLTTHFVNAKRSLSTTQHVFRANELVTSSRALVEEIAVLNARNEYATRAAQDGVKVLEDVRCNIEKQGDDAQAEFDRVIEGLDEANGRLMATLERLRGTVVDAALQRQGETVRSKADLREEDDEEDHRGSEERQLRGEEKTLLTFIDESKHETIQASLRAQIDEFNGARDDLTTSLQVFAQGIRVIDSLLSPPPASPEPPELLRPALYDEPAPTIPQLFHSVTDNASTMASLLQSLVSHYDLCVTALKHTEGGGEAARQAVQKQQRNDSPSASNEGTGGLPKSKQNLEESLYQADHASPISADERREMLKVLERDSSEVEDVVAELGDHARDLESAFDKLASSARKTRERDKTLRNIVALLHEMQDIHLPSHLHSLQTFTQDWTRIKSTITHSTAQLSDLSDFYAEFFEGYKKLLREVERRGAAAAQMRKIAEKAKRDIERVRIADEEARKGFMDEVGRVLPGDLWPALHMPGRRWEVVEAPSVEEKQEEEEEE